ncbi:MAG: type II toxin-antitoxin system VapC family toxin [Cyanobacteria bacterium CRU_2_1]|nr:type II toxin-antitoxin system VapC family toxin [Cyanobacteria bacterium RU_5_0]NJR58478.1 type II toxin-antitoxin system VapC family toxin [Cyanobacteria bacterium CRU_2_1]NJR58524.1 type II toxin-antitoxin system VapC family toxin [Cyanobacteria bacterium CRU_2_1]
MDKVLLDTDVFSQILRRYNSQIVVRSAAYLANFGQFTISAVTALEIVKGWHKLQREDRIQQFVSGLSSVEVMVMNLDDFLLTGRISADLERMGQPIGLADTMIAAAALQNNLTLITGNRSHYQRIVLLGYSLRLDSWLNN